MLASSTAAATGSSVPSSVMPAALNGIMDGITLSAEGAGLPSLATVGQLEPRTFLGVGGVTPRKRRFFSRTGWVGGWPDPFCGGWLRGLRSLANAGWSMHALVLHTKKGCILVVILCAPLGIFWGP